MMSSVMVSVPRVPALRDNVLGMCSTGGRGPNGGSDTSAVKI